jgi:hypothetical protein
MSTRATTKRKRGTYYPRRFAIAVATAMAFCATCFAEKADELTIEINAGQHDRVMTPVGFEIPADLVLPEQPLLVRADDGQVVDAQLEASQPPVLWWILRDRLARGRLRHYRLVADDRQAASRSTVSVSDDGRRLVVNLDDKPVLHYNHAVVPSADPEKPHYARSGFIHPVFSPQGKVLTDGMPVDHMHQHGIMFAWRDSEFEGRRVNFWEAGEGQGRVEHVAVESMTSGSVFGRFVVRLQHVDATVSPPKTALEETWTVRVFAVDSQFVWDLESIQTTAGDSPLVAKKIHYGCMMIRGHADWRNGDFLTSEGHTRTTGNHTRPQWVDIHGTSQGHLAGITVINHSGNFRSPQPVRLHPSMPYFCFAPVILGEFAIETGQQYRSRFRFLAHDGAVKPPDVNFRLNDYVDPPIVRMVR